MVFLWSFEKIYNFLHFSLGLMQTRNVCELYIDVFDYIKLLLLLGRCGLPHRSLGRTHYRGDDEGNKQ